jgi:hypothetical protein
VPSIEDIEKRLDRVELRQDSIEAKMQVRMDGLENKIETKIDQLTRDVVGMQSRFYLMIIGFLGEIIVQVLIYYFPHK